MTEREFAQARAEAIRTGTFETKVAGPVYEDKMAPHTRSAASYGSPSIRSEERRLRRVVAEVDKLIERAEAEVRRRKPKGTKPTPKTKPKPKTVKGVRLVPVRQVPNEKYFAAQRMRSLASDMLGLHAPWPLLRWSTADELGKAVGLMQGGEVFIACDVPLKRVIGAVAHELMHCHQLQKGEIPRSTFDVTPKVRKRAEAEARAFSERAMRAYRREYGPESAAGSSAAGSSTRRRPVPRPSTW